MTDAELAIDECRKVAASIKALGRAGTVDEIAAVHGLPRDMICRRLRGSSAQAPSGVRRYFCFDNVTRTWGLTHDGRELVKPRRAKG